MPKMTFNRSASAGGASYSLQKVVEGDNLITTKKTMAAAKTGTLTVRTDTNTGTLTMAGGHGILTGDKICVFWDGGYKSNMTVGSVSGNSVPIDLGSGGGDLPAASTPVKVMVQDQETSGWTIALANIQGILAGCDGGPFVVSFLNNSGAELASFYSPSADVYGFSFDPVESANNLTGLRMDSQSVGLSSGSIASVVMAHGDSTRAHDISAAVLVN